MGHYHCVGSRYARPTYILEVDECALIVRTSLFYGRKKTRHIAVTGFSYLEPGNVLLSHSKCYTIIGAVSFHY